jgi:hypothetical protein
VRKEEETEKLVADPRVMNMHVDQAGKHVGAGKAARSPGCAAGGIISDDRLDPVALDR